MTDNDWEQENDDHYEQNAEQHQYICSKCKKEFEEWELEDFDGNPVCDDCLETLKDEYSENIRSLFDDMIDDHITLRENKNTTASELEDSFDEYIDIIKKELF